jgi:hypothetical protein
MAATYTIAGQNIPFAANKCMIGVFNGVGSAKVLKVYRIWCLNNQLVPVTGVLTNLEIRRITSCSGGTDIVPTKHDSLSATLPIAVLAGTNQTVIPTAMFRRVMWSTDEPATAGATVVTLDEIETFVPFGTIWSLGYADSTVDPIVLREGEGLAVINTGANVGQADLFMEVIAI